MKRFLLLITILGILFLTVCEFTFAEEWNWEKGLPPFESGQWEYPYAKPRPENLPEDIIAISRDVSVRVDYANLFLVYRFKYNDGKGNKIDVLFYAPYKEDEEIQKTGIKPEEKLQINQWWIFKPKFALAIFFKKDTNSYRVIGYPLESEQKPEKWSVKLKDQQLLISKKTRFYQEIRKWIETIVEEKSQKTGKDLEKSINDFPLGYDSLLPIIIKKDNLYYLNLLSI